MFGTTILWFSCLSWTISTMSLIVHLITRRSGRRHRRQLPSVPYIVAVLSFKIKITRQSKVPCPLTHLPSVPSLTVKSIWHRYGWPLPWSRAGTKSREIESRSKCSSPRIKLMWKLCSFCNAQNIPNYSFHLGTILYLTPISPMK